MTLFVELTIKSWPFTAGLDHKPWLVLDGLDQPPGCKTPHSSPRVCKVASCEANVPHFHKEPIRFKEACLINCAFRLCTAGNALYKIPMVVFYSGYTFSES